MKILLSNPTEYQTPKIPKTHIKNSVGVIIDTVCDGEAGSLSVVLIGYTTENASTVTLEVVFTSNKNIFLRTTALVKIKRDDYLSKFNEGCGYLLSQIFDIKSETNEYPLDALSQIANRCSTNKKYVLLAGDTLMSRTGSAHAEPVFF